MEVIKKFDIPNLGTVEEIENIFSVFAPDDSPALTIEGLKLKGLNYPIMVQKGLHIIGGLVVYIRWDACLPEIDLFKSFIAPNDDPKKSILGPNNRVRVVKLAGNFSYGIVLPLKEIMDYLGFENIGHKDITEDLGLFKTETINDNFLIEGDVPSFLYKTDEINIYDVDNYDIEIKEIITQLYKEKQELQFTVKRDGGSETIYSNQILATRLDGICSRTSKIRQVYNLNDIPFNLRVEMVKHKIGHTKLTKDLILKNASNDEEFTFLNDEEKWEKRGKENLLKTEAEFNLYYQICAGYAEKVKPAIENFKLKLRLEPSIQAENDHHYLPKFIEYCKKNNKNYALRGETLGYSKGGANSKNPDKKNRQVIWFGLDEIDPISTRIPTNADINLYTVCEELGFEATPIIKKGVFSFDEIIAFSEDYFKTRMVEGLIIRTTNDNRLSCKKMNSFYDTK